MPPVPTREEATGGGVKKEITLAHERRDETFFFR
jgi:hypothetical protein